MPHTFKPDDRFLWPAGNGRRVRTGIVDRWMPARPNAVGRRGSWMVRLDPIADLGQDKPLSAWLYPEEMFPVDTDPAVLAAYSAGLQQRWYGESLPLVELTRAMTDAVTLVREALHRAFPEAYAVPECPHGYPHGVRCGVCGGNRANVEAAANPGAPLCPVCSGPKASGEVECKWCAAEEDAAAKRAADD